MYNFFYLYLIFFYYYKIVINLIWYVRPQCKLMYLDMSIIKTTYMRTPKLSSNWIFMRNKNVYISANWIFMRSKLL